MMLLALPVRWHAAASRRAAGPRPGHFAGAVAECEAAQACRNRPAATARRFIAFRRIGGGLCRFWRRLHQRRARGRGDGRDRLRPRADGGCSGKTPGIARADADRADLPACSDLSGHRFDQHRRRRFGARRRPDFRRRRQAHACRPAIRHRCRGAMAVSARRAVVFAALRLLAQGGIAKATEAEGVD